MGVYAALTGVHALAVAAEPDRDGNAGSVLPAPQATQ